MKQFLRELLDEKSSTSTIRVMSIFALLIGSGIAIYGVYLGKDLGGVAAIVGIFIGSAFGGKVVQKFTEGE